MVREVLVHLLRPPEPPPGPLHLHCIPQLSSANLNIARIDHLTEASTISTDLLHAGKVESVEGVEDPADPGGGVERDLQQGEGAVEPPAQPLGSSRVGHFLVIILLHGNSPVKLVDFCLFSKLPRSSMPLTVYEQVQVLFLHFMNSTQELLLKMLKKNPPIYNG